MSDCLFCKIINNEIPSERLYEDEHCIVIKDINPQAPIHHLVIPKKHIATINDCDESDTHLVGHMIQTAKNNAKQLGIADDGYRLIFNCNSNGGQEVYHIHLHLLGGEKLGCLK
jgi:histidine triad (HIT) family protein